MEVFIHPAARRLVPVAAMALDTYNPDAKPVLILILKKTIILSEVDSPVTPRGQ
jgi:hypothetical protein